MFLQYRLLCTLVLKGGALNIFDMFSSNEKIRSSADSLCGRIWHSTVYLRDDCNNCLLVLVAARHAIIVKICRPRFLQVRVNICFSTHLQQIHFVSDHLLLERALDTVLCKSVLSVIVESKVDLLFGQRPVVCQRPQSCPWAAGCSGSEPGVALGLWAKPSSKCSVYRMQRDWVNTEICNRRVKGNSNLSWFLLSFSPWYDFET